MKSSSKATGRKKPAGKMKSVSSSSRKAAGLKPAGEKHKPRLSVVSAKDYVPGKENEVLEGVQELLVSSTELVSKKCKGATSNTSKWFWESTQVDEKKKIWRTGTDAKEAAGLENGDWTPNEMDGIMDSMTYVLEVMDNYQAKANKAAKDFMEKDDLVQKTDKALKKESGMWNIHDFAKDMSSADFFLGSFMPTHVVDEYPEGSEHILSRGTFMGPAMDMFMGSLSSFWQIKPELHNGNLLMDSKLRYLEDIQSVRSICTSQIRELDAILSQELNTGIVQDKDTFQEQDTGSVEAKEEFMPIQALDTDSVENKGASRGEGPVEEFEAGLNAIEELDTDYWSKPGMAEAFELHASVSIVSNNSVVTKDVEDKPHPPIKKTALSYIQAARDKLAEYSDFANNILKDEVKCMVSEYTCASEKFGDSKATPEDKDALYFEPLRKHFYGDAYNMDFKSYLSEDKDNTMQIMLLNCLHSSLFLRNVGDKCQQPIRIQVGEELSECLCDLVMDSLVTSEKDHRMTEWGACLLAKHVRALHSYVYAFCFSYEGTEHLLSKVMKCSVDAPPMDTNWEQLFKALDLLKLESLDDYNDGMLHPLCTTKNARHILRLRVEFDDQAINDRVQPPRNPVDKRVLG